MTTPYRSDAGQVEALLAALPAAGAIPRECGEASFDAPWELRALALGVAAHEAGEYAWADFQHELIRSIKDWEATGGNRTDWRYYDRWLEAFEALLTGSGVIGTDELDERTKMVLATPRNAEHQHAHHDPVAVDPAH
jgi:nitrile hydratase accessory protein